MAQGVQAQDARGLARGRGSWSAAAHKLFLTGHTSLVQQGMHLGKLLGSLMLHSEGTQLQGRQLQQVPILAAHESLKVRPPQSDGEVALPARLNIATGWTPLGIPAFRPRPKYCGQHLKDGGRCAGAPGDEEITVHS
jgi:hypothetical protein